MEKNTLGTFLWLTISIIIALSFVAFASPFGAYIQDNVETFAGEYIEQHDTSMESTEQPLYNITIKYEFPNDSGLSMPSTVVTLKKYEKYNIIPPQKNGYEPNMDVVSGIATSDTEITIQYTKGNYTILYVTNEGEWEINYVPDEKYTFEETVLLPTAENIKRNHYAFDGWYTNKELTGAPITSITPSDFGDKVLYAKWKSAEYSVMYHLNDTAEENGHYYRPNDATNIASWNDEVLDGSGKLQEKYTNYTYGEQMKLPVGVSKFGYTFKGWSTDKDGSNPDNYRTQMTEKDDVDIILYAQWERKTYDIHYNLSFVRPVKDENGNFVKADFAITDTVYIVKDIYGNEKEYEGFPITYNYGDTIELPTSIYYPGYDQYMEHSIWFNKDTEQIEITAVGNPMTDDIVNGYPENVTRKNSISPSTVGFANDDAEYIFDYTDLYLYAKPIPNNYYIAYDKNSPTDEVYNTGTNMTTQLFVYDLAKPLKKNTYSYKGYEFVGWNTEKDGSGKNFSDNELILNGEKASDINASLKSVIKPNETITLYAQWKPKKVNVTFKYYFETFKDGEYVIENSLTKTETFDSDTTQYASGYVKTFTGFTYNKTTISDKASNFPKNESNINANSSFRVLPDGNREVHFYYTRNTYTFKMVVKQSDMFTSATAQLVKMDKTLTFNQNSSGAILEQVVYNVKYQETLNFSATHPIQYRVKRWYTDDGNEWPRYTKSLTHTMPAYDLTMTLENEWNQADITFKPNDGNGNPKSSWNGTDDKRTFTYGQKYSATGFPSISRNCYTFDGWYTAATGGTKVNESDTFVYGNTLTLYAHWSYVDASQTTRHKYGSWERITNPTCTTKGRDRKVCQDGCGAIIYQDVAALGHNFTGAYRHVDYYTHDRKCTRCSAYGASASHSWYVSSSSAATCYAQGATYWKCHYCSITDTTYTAQLSHDFTYGCNVSHMYSKLGSSGSVASGGQRGTFSCTKKCSGWSSKLGQSVYVRNATNYGTCPKYNEICTDSCYGGTTNGYNNYHWYKYRCRTCYRCSARASSGFVWCGGGPTCSNGNHSKITYTH